MDEVCEMIYHGVEFDREMTRRGGLDGMKATDGGVIRDRLMEEARSGARAVIDTGEVPSDSHPRRYLDRLAQVLPSTHRFDIADVEHDAMDLYSCLEELHSACPEATDAVVISIQLIAKLLTRAASWSEEGDEDDSLCPEAQRAAGEFARETKQHEFEHGKHFGEAETESEKDADWAETQRLIEQVYDEANRLQKDHQRMLDDKLPTALHTHLEAKPLQLGKFIVNDGVLALVEVVHAADVSSRSLPRNGSPHMQELVIITIYGHMCYN